MNATVAGNVRREAFTTNVTQTTGISVAGIYNVSNAAITPTLGQYETRRNVNSAYGSAALTYAGWWTVEGTARNDWSSTLPRGENSYFYPSINTSIVLTDAVPAIRNRYLTYLKIRGGLAEVGNDAEPYQLLTTFTGRSSKFNGLPQFTLGQNLLEPNLKPELTKSGEVGDKVTRNQIYLVPVSATSGFANKLINAGRMQNKGFEALLTVTPVQLRNLTWTTSFNYASNKNKVVELAPGVSRIVLGNGLFTDFRLEARKGQPYGALWGGDLLRNAQGRLLTHNGIPVQTDTFVYLGSIQPNWTGGWNNQVTYRGVTLSALLDIRRGGKIMSYTNYVGAYSGVLKETLRGREVDWDDPGIVVDGVDDVTGQPNTVRLTAEEYWQSLFGATGAFVYDASYVKLREVRLGFDLPQRYAGVLKAQSVSLALTARNLALWTDVPNVDPEFAYSSNNFQGVEYGLPANPRSIGVSLRITP
jgi:hypothetical protein